MQLAIKKGFASVDGPINSGRCGDRPVIAKNLDAIRDEQCGVDLSKYNLNYVFNDDQTSAAASMKEKENCCGSCVILNVLSDRMPAKFLNPMVSDWITDQGEYGACSANAIAHCIRRVRMKYGLDDFPPSRLFLYFYGRLLEGFAADVDSGMSIQSGCQVAQDSGTCSEPNWAYSDKKIFTEPSDYAKEAASKHEKLCFIRVGQDIKSIKHLLINGYPVIFGFTVFPSFMTADVAATGNVPLPDFETEEPNGGHAVVLIGYDDASERFTFANSFSTNWGQGGYGSVPYAYVLNAYYARDFCTINVKR